MVKNVRVGKFILGKGQRTFIIAEIGGNFTTLEDGKKLVNLAVESGADAVKLQTYTAKNTATKEAFINLENTGEINQYEYFQNFELSPEIHKEIFDYCKEKGILCFSTPSHPEDVELLESLGVEVYKVGSDDAINLPLLTYIAKKNKPILMSTGMCTLEEVREAVNTILKYNDKLVLLHAISNYPSYAEDANLKVIETFYNEFDLPIGFSDHSLGIELPIAAVALGACVVEKHFTYDKNAEGPDHMLSATPEEMKDIIKSIRLIEDALGDGEKKPTEKELKSMKYMRKSIVATKDIPTGTTITEEMIDIKRPCLGILPKEFENVVGKIAKTDIKEDDISQWDRLS